VRVGGIDRRIESSSIPSPVALVTGSATGIGRAVAIRFAAQGLAVAVNYSRSEVEARETLAAVKAHGAPALLGQANVADDAAVRALVARCRDELGGLDVLVNNAGTPSFAPAPPIGPGLPGL
jgi:3-oxoacyl-[acyl-carrier protein] reductase